MTEKIISFLATLALIGWNVLDITRGNHPVVSWILIGVFSIGGLFELGAILEEKKRRNAAPEQA